MDDIKELEGFPASDSGNRMLGYVTAGFYDNSYVGKWLYQVMGQEYDGAREMMEALPIQFFPETATWGLRYHEMKWGLPIRENLLLEERRRLIYQKRDQKPPMTPCRMEEYLGNVTAFKVHVCDVHDPGEYGLVFSHPNVFRVICMGEGTLDSKAVHRLLDRIKQSHTVYILNDRMEIVMDNRRLEKMFLRHIKVYMGISFWGCRVLDGSWLLDGGVPLDARRRYDLVLRLRNAWALPPVEEGIKSHAVSVACKAVMEEQISGFVQGLRLDCDALGECVEPAVDLHYEAENGSEEIGNGSVTIRRNLWYLDGTVFLDGSRILNAMVREESL